MLNRLTLDIRTDNAAFQGDHEADSTECARILRDIASKLDRGDRGGPVRDCNGNRVGSWTLEREDD